MILSDTDIRRELAAGNLKISPMADRDIQPASVDLHLDRRLLAFSYGKDESLCLDPLDQHRPAMQDVTPPDDRPFLLEPGAFVLGNTIERITMPRHLAGRAEGKSSLGRLGLQVHCTAGFTDPGYDGQLTLEFSNLAGKPIVLYYRMAICQLTFTPLFSPASRVYGDAGLGSKYQGSTGPVASRAYLDRG